MTSVKLLTLGQPIFKIGEDGHKAQASLNLTSTAGADILYDLAAGKMTVGRVQFVADNVHFHFLNPAGELDLNGIKLTNPDVTLAHLEVTIAGTPKAYTGIGDLRAFAATASHVYKPPVATKPTELTFDSRIARPLTIGEIRALKVQIGDVFSFEGLQLSKFDLGVTDGDIVFGKDISVNDARIDLTVDQFDRIELNGQSVVEMQNASISVAGKLDAGLNNRPGFQISLRASGPSDNLDGTGTAR